MTRALAKLFAIRPGEEKKTLLLYGLHLIFYLGLMWGDAAREALFLTNWSAEDLAWMFVGYAVLAAFMGVIYSFFADRVSNNLLLWGINGLMLIWLLSVRLLLETHGGPRGAVYPYFYLVYSAFRDLSTMHILNYINDFYDTRAAKRALPLMLSAGIAGGMLAGFSGGLLSRTIGLQNVTLAWAVCLAVCFILMWVIQRSLAADLAHIQDVRRSTRGGRAQSSYLGNLRSGYNFVRESSLLRWLAFATIVMVVLMNLLIFQSGRFFISYFHNDSEAMFNFYNLLGGLANVVGLLIQSVLLSRLIFRFGVGNMNLFFPFFTLAAVGLISFATNFVTAVFARLDHSMIKQVFRNPLDAMLYNSVPLDVKNRARGFVNGLIVPLGTLAAGVLVMGLRYGWLPLTTLAWIALGVALAYVVSMLRVRVEYGNSLAELLERDEMLMFRMSRSETDRPDPATLELLQQRLWESEDDQRTIFLAEMIYELQDQAALTLLIGLVALRGPMVRVGVIQILTPEQMYNPVVYRLCLESLSHPDSSVRNAAAQALLGLPKLRQSAQAQAALRAALPELDEITQAEVLPVLLLHSDADGKAQAERILESWLQTDTADLSFEMGLRVLARVGDERLLPTLEKLLQDRASFVRRRAVELVGELAAKTNSKQVKNWGLERLCSRLTDESDAVRLAVVQGFVHYKVSELGPALWQALSDPILEVRSQACRLAGAASKRELERLLDTETGYMLESAAYILAKSNQARGKRRVIQIVRELVEAAYAWYQQYVALETVDLSGARLMQDVLAENAQAVVRRVFWLMTALDDQEQVQTVYRALQSEDAITRANAGEALETILSPDLARPIRPLLDGRPASRIAEVGQKYLEQSPVTPWQVFCWAWPQLDGGKSQAELSPILAAEYSDGWLAAVAIYVLIELYGANGRLQIDGLPGELNESTLREALQTSLDDGRLLVRETSKMAIERLGNPV